ncbi:hypothetical protein PhaeoP97_00018 [Phaeobacter porticola]|uniref:Uncharacterized protein n=1 Tax=Phaeobacter porticola TaxID=1844006 RepID=A0A1L3I033_9RHOB|nr:hypothetical protein PhaeoP97_00018 [Phaeobacter porticola]
MSMYYSGFNRVGLDCLHRQDAMHLTPHDRRKSGLTGRTAAIGKCYECRLWVGSSFSFAFTIFSRIKFFQYMYAAFLASVGKPKLLADASDLKFAVFTT